MFDKLTRTGRRDLIDAGYALLLLLLAIVTGYLILTPSDIRATPLARPLPEPRPGLVTDRLTPTGHVEPTRTRRSWPRTVTGKVLDSHRQPLEGAGIVVDGKEYLTGPDGTFKFEGSASRTPLLVKMPGFEKATVEPHRGAVEVVLRPQVIKAAYLTYYGVSDRVIRNRVLDLVVGTELNAVVIDVKGDRGWIVYPTEIPEALAAGAQGPATLRDFDAFMSDLKSRGVYTIGRIVTFKDNALANHRRDLAVIDTRTGQPWMDNEKLAWLDPFREEVWDYNLAIAREAVRRGFDEIQLPTIAAFLARARRELGAMGAFVAADVFGYTAFNENDTDIGQRIEELTPHLDYISPMVYPSGYQRGIPNYRNPVEHPYEVVFETVRLILKRSGHTRVRVRPWLQDFRDYAFDHRPFGVPEILAQIKAADDGGALGWMLWNPRNDYTSAALRQKEGLAVK